MNHSFPRWLPLAVILSALALLTVGLSACSDDDPVCPDFQLGAVEGYVTVVGEPMAATTVIAFKKEQSPTASEASALTDDVGHFRLDLANGLYFVEIQNHPNEQYSSSNTDTVRVASDLTNLDFAWGRADVRVGLPPELIGRRCTLTLETFPQFSQSTTVQEGWTEFTFPLVKPGPYTMRFRCGAMDVDLPAAMTPSDFRDTLTVRPDVPAYYEVDLSSSYATLSGRLTGGWEQVGGPIPRIQYFSPDSLRLDRVSPDAEGNFTIETLSSRDIVLRTDLWNGTERWIGGRSCAAATHYTLKPGDPITGVEIPESRIRITLNGPDGMIDHDASIRLVNDHEDEFLFSGFSGPDPLLVGNLDAGRWFLQVNGYNTGQTWAARWYLDADSLGAATPIDLGEGEAADLVMDLVLGGSITGQVLLFGSVPLNSIECALYDADGKPISGYENPIWQDFDRGRIAFAGLPNGAFYLAARQFWTLEPVWYPGTMDFDLAQPVTIRDYGVVTDIDWDLLDIKEVRP